MPDKDFEKFFRPGAAHAEEMNFVQATILAAYPAAQERVSYACAAWFASVDDGGKVLLYVKAQTKHLGLYPRPAFIREFSQDLNDYKTSKGAIQVPYRTEQNILATLIGQIVSYNLKKSREK